MKADRFICIECGHPVKDLFQRYQGDIIKVIHCVSADFRQREQFISVHQPLSLGQKHIITVLSVVAAR